MHTEGVLVSVLRWSGKNQTLSVGYPGQGGRERERPLQGESSQVHRPRAQSPAAILTVESIPAVAASPGILMEMQIPRPHPRLIELHTLGGRTQQSVLTSPPGEECRE